MADSSHVKAYRSRHLGQDEIRATAEGYIGKTFGSGKDMAYRGALIVTSKNVVFYRKGFFGEINQSIPIKSITSIEQKSLLGLRTVRFHTSHDDLEFTTGEAKEYAAILSAVEAGRAQAAPPAAPAAPAGDAGDALDALRKLGELRAAGVINDAEFEAKKASLLARL